MLLIDKKRQAFWRSLSIFLAGDESTCFSCGKSPPSQLQIARLILLKTIINRFLYAKFPLGVRLSIIIYAKIKVGCLLHPTFILEQVKGGIVCTLATPSKPIFLREFRGFFTVFSSFFILYPNTYSPLISYSLPLCRDKNLSVIEKALPIKGNAF